MYLFTYIWNRAGHGKLEILPKLLIFGQIRYRKNNTVFDALYYTVQAHRVQAKVKADY